jgi:hypothetical protein
VITPLLETNYAGLGLLVSGVCVGISSVIAAVGGIILGLRGVAAVKQGANASAAGALLAADTNRKITDPTTGQEAVHKLVNSNMTRMFWALGISSATIAGLVLFSLREVARTAKGRDRLQA